MECAAAAAAGRRGPARAGRWTVTKGFMKRKVMAL